MVNILLESYDLDADWLYDELKEYLKPVYAMCKVQVALVIEDNNIKKIGNVEIFE